MTRPTRSAEMRTKTATTTESTETELTTTMEIQRALVDRQFERYVLSAEGVEKQDTVLPTAVLTPLDAANTTRKAQWDARVHHNALAADPFRSEALEGSVAYYLDANFQLMQAVWTKTTGLVAQPIYGNLKPQQRKENASIQVAALGVLVANDGSGTLRILKSGNAPAVGAPWEIMYEFQPLQDTATLLIKANYDEEFQRFAMVLAEPLVGADKDAAYRLWVAEVSAATTSESMDIDNGAVGLQHSAFEVGVASTLPDYAAFSGQSLALLVEGTCTLMIEAKGQVVETVAAPAPVEATHATKRHHDESDMDMDVDEVLSKVPRAGIGYHGDVSDTKHPQDLAADADLAKPLAERFRKSSIPYSSLDEPLHSTSPEAVRSPKSQAMEGLEVPTPETILGGFEECDDVDPNAKAVLLLINTKQQRIHDKLDINCRSFRYLGKSASRSSKTGASFDASLLFQNDVHGLVFDLQLAESRLALRHTATFPAFGFVQASKQDKKYLTYDPRARFATIGEFEKRLFVYHGEPATPQQIDAHERTQNVVEIGDHQLLGLCAVGAAILLLSPHHVYHVQVAAKSA